MQAIVDAEAAGRFTRKLFQDSHMKRATKRGAFVGDAACCAFYAGVDVLLMPAQPEIAIEMLGYALLRGTKQWRIHLEESLRRIRTLKEFVGLLPAGKPIVGLQPQLFIEHKQLALKIALTACDVASPVDNNLLPLPEHAPLAVFSILQQAEDLQAASRFFTMLGQATENDCDFAYLDETITRAQLGDMAENIDDAELLIFALFYRGRGYSERLGNADTVNEIIRVLSGGRPFIVICFGDHYIADSLDGDTKILTYSDSFASLAAAVAVLVGRGETVLGKS